MLGRAQLSVALVISLLGLLSTPVVAVSLSRAVLNPYQSAQDPSEEAVRLHREAVGLYERKEYRRALKKFEEALALAPGEKAIRVSLGRSCVAVASQLLDSAGNTDSRELAHAASLLQKALLHWEGDAATHELIAMCAIRRDRLDEAERALTKAVEFDRDSARAWTLLGVIRDRRGKISMAIEALQRALEIRPSDPELLRRLRRLEHDRLTISEGRPLESSRFRVYVPNSLPLASGRSVLEQLTKVSEELERRWGGTPPSRAEVILYPPGEFSRRTGFAEEVGGAFDGRIRIAFPTELEEGGLSLEQVIRHEAAHLFLHRFSVTLPRWLDEGLAQLVDGGDRSPWPPQFLERGGAAAAIGLRERERSVEEEKPQSWAGLYLHSYLFLRHLEELHGQFRLDLTIRRIARGESVGSAFQAVYGETPEQLDRQWRSELRGGGKSGE